MRGAHPPSFRWKRPRIVRRTRLQVNVARGGKLSRQWKTSLAVLTEPSFSSQRELASQKRIAAALLQAAANQSRGKRLGCGFLVNVNLNACGNIAEHLDGDGILAERLDGVAEVHLALVDLKALRSKPFGNVR